MHFQKPRNSTRQVRNKAHDSAPGRFFCTLGITLTKRALAYGYITFKKHRKFGNITLHLRHLAASWLRLQLRFWPSQCTKGRAGRLPCGLGCPSSTQRRPVLKVDRNFIIALVGGLAQAVRASRAPQGVLFSNLNTPFRNHKEYSNKSM